MFKKKTKFLENKSASVSLVFGLAAMVLILAAGGAVDYSRATGVAEKLQATLDASVLAAADLRQTGAPAEVVHHVVHGSLASVGDRIRNTLEIEVTSDEALNERTVHVTASVRVPTFFLGIAGISEIKVVRNTVATDRQRNVEISLVLDISSSMGGAKIDNLRDAALQFIDTVLDEDGPRTTSLSLIPYGGTVRLPDDFFRFVRNGAMYSPPGFAWQIEVPPNRQAWNRCLDMRADEVDDIALSPGGFGILPRFTVWTRGNEWCPDADATTAIFLTDDRHALRTALSSFDNPILSDGTGTDIGTSWGVRALDPAWRGGFMSTGPFANRPRPYGEDDLLKVMVVMTDGAITAQLRPHKHWDPVNDDNHVKQSGTDQLYPLTDARQNFQSLCDYAKSKGILVYTISFQVQQQWAKDDMQSCATSMMHYFDVNGLDIGAAFRTIASNIGGLRIAK